MALKKIDTPTTAYLRDKIREEDLTLTVKEKTKKERAAFALIPGGRTKVIAYLNGLKNGIVLDEHIDGLLREHLVEAHVCSRKKDQVSLDQLGELLLDETNIHSDSWDSFYYNILFSLMNTKYYLDRIEQITTKEIGVFFEKDTKDTNLARILTFLGVLEESPTELTTVTDEKFYVRYLVKDSNLRSSIEEIFNKQLKRNTTSTDNYFGLINIRGLNVNFNDGWQIKMLGFDFNIASNNQINLTITIIVLLGLVFWIKWIISAIVNRFN